MKKFGLRKRIAVLLLALALLLVSSCVLTEAETISGGNAGLHYKQVGALFAMAQYDEVLALLEAYPELLEQEIGFSRQYETYCKAMLAYDGAMEKWVAAETEAEYQAAREEITLARQLFFSLNEYEFDFNESAKWLAYLDAWLAEEAGDYAAAIEGYTSVVTFRDSEEHLRECIKLQVGKEKADAEELNRQLYTKAQSNKMNAEKSNETDTMREAFELFTQLGDYKDSAAMAAECSKWLASASRLLSLTAGPFGADSIGVSVQDSNAAANTKYTVTCVPVGCVAGGVKNTFSGTACTVSGLIPGTEYVVTVTDSENSQVKNSDTVTTYDAARWHDGSVKVTYRSLYAFDRMYLNLLDLADIVTNYRIMRMQDNPSFALRSGDIDEQADCWVIMLTFNKSFADYSGEKHKIYWALRTPASGTYVTQTEEVKFTDTTVIFSLDGLLGSFYADHGAWEISEANVELYIDGLLAGNMTLTVQGSGS